MQLTEQIYLKKTQVLSQLCHLAKNLYNEANYLIRQRLFQTGYWLRFYELNDLLHSSLNYQALPIQTAQQLLLLLDRNWKSFFKAIKDWVKHPEKYLGRPKLPRYKKKDGESIVIFTNQQCKLKDGFLIFPRKANLAPVKTRIETNLHQVRIIPKGICYIVEIVYEKIEQNLNLDKGKIIGIDLGLINLITIVNNIGLKPSVIRGGIIKSVNQFYNKQKASYQALKDLQHYKFETKRLQRLTLKRNNTIHDFFHKVSRKLINYCILGDFGTIIIGYNEAWKQNIALGKRANQNFVQIPFLQLIQMIRYKAKLVGIEVVIDEESYTSLCSFFDNEPIGFHPKYVGTRINRGLFQTGARTVVNADVNGGYNIIKKVVPNAFANGIADVVGHPYSVSITE